MYVCMYVFIRRYARTDVVGELAEERDGGQRHALRLCRRVCVRVVATRRLGHCKIGPCMRHHPPHVVRVPTLRVKEPSSERMASNHSTGTNSTRDFFFFFFSSFPLWLASASAAAPGAVSVG